MQYVERMELFQRSIRARVCPKCYQRPPQSENLPATEPRTCEGNCPIFLSLPKVVAASVRQQRDPAPADDLLREMVCQTCRASPTAGDYCAESLARTCPLSRYGQDVLDVLERVMHQAK